MGLEFEARERQEKLDYFAKGEFTDRFVYAGVFFNNMEDYKRSLANLVYKIYRREDGTKELFENFLCNLNFKVEGTALYPAGEVNRWIKPFRLISGGKRVCFDRYKKDSKVNIFELKVQSSYEMEKRAGLVFLRLLGFDSENLSEEIRWKARKEVLYLWLELSQNQEVREYLIKVKNIVECIEVGLEYNYFKFPFNKLFYYLVPIDFDRFENAVVISKASLFFRKEETIKGLWDEIMQKMEKGQKKDLEYFLEKEGLSWDFIRETLQRALSSDFLKSLRQDWKLVIRKILGGSKKDKVLGVFMGKGLEDKGAISYGRFCVPDRQMELLVFAEDGLTLESGGKVYNAQQLANFLKDEIENAKFVGELKITVDSRVRSLEALFGFSKPKEEDSQEESVKIMDVIKGNLWRTNGKVRSKETLSLLYALTHFSTRLAGLVSKTKKENKVQGILLLLNTELDDGEQYALWNDLSFMYDYFGVPVQTITKRSLRVLLEGEEKEADATIKNIIISLYKDSKTLEFEFEGFSLPPDTVVYAVLEKPSPAILYAKVRSGEQSMEKGLRHILYEVYKISVKEKEASVELENKYLVMAGAYGDEAKRLENWIREELQKKNTRFCFITAMKDSVLEELENRLGSPSELEGKVLRIRYKELKTAYFSQKADKDCYVIYSQEMLKLFETLGIQMDKGATAIAIKPTNPQRYEDYYHTDLQVFFTERVGWQREEVYAERKSLFIFTVLALSMYESESHKTPYSKLDLWSKDKSVYVEITRGYNTYEFPLRAITYELLHLIAPLPLKENL